LHRTLLKFECFR